MIKLKDILNEAKLPSFIHLDIPANSVESTKLTAGEVMGGIQFVANSKKAGVPEMGNGYYALVKDNGKIALKLSQKGKTRIKVVSKTIPDYLSKITKVANTTFKSYFDSKK